MKGEYAPLRSRHGKERIAALQRRIALLQDRIRAANLPGSSFDKREESALRWLIDKSEELRAKLDQIIAITRERANSDLAAEIEKIASEETPKQNGSGRV